MSSRNLPIENVRIVATLLVILVHVGSSYLTNQESYTFDGNFQFANLIQSVSRICVPLFILISGRLLICNSDSIQTFYLKRIKRLVWPILFWSCFYILYRLSLTILSGNKIDFSVILKSLILGKPYYHLWYLYMIIGLFSATPIINFIVKNSKVEAIKTYSIILLVVCSSLNFYHYKVGYEPSFLIEFIYYLGFYLFGYTSIFINKIKISNLVMTYFLSVAAIIYFATKELVLYNDAYFYEYPSPFVVVSSLSVYLLFTQQNIVFTMLSGLAQYSFGVYLIHPFFLSILDHIIEMFEINYLHISYIGIPFKFLIISAVSFISIFLLTKVKGFKKVV